MSAANRFFTVVRRYASAERRRPIGTIEAIGSMVRWYANAEKLAGMDTSSGSAWRGRVADFLVREYAVVARDFPQTTDGVLSWISVILGDEKQPLKKG